jgi:hypothetical protein
LSVNTRIIEPSFLTALFLLSAPAGQKYASCLPQTTARDHPGLLVEQEFTMLALLNRQSPPMYEFV